MPHTISGIQKMLSLLVEVPIEHSSSKYNPSLDVSLKSQRLKLSTRNTIYSFEDRYTSFSKAFRHLDIGTRSVDSVLMLGYGFGSIPIILSRKYNLNPDITAIEIDPEVIRLAKKYALQENVTLLEGDAYRWVLNNQDRFDLVCVDVFFDTRVSGKFESRKFLQKLRTLVAPDGLLLFNRLTMEKGLKTATERFYNQDFKSVFPTCHAISSSGNLVCIFHNE